MALITIHSASPETKAETTRESGLDFRQRRCCASSTLGRRIVLSLFCMILFCYSAEASLFQSSQPAVSRDLSELEVDDDPILDISRRQQQASLPQPFDSILGNNFTAPCQQFFNTFLSDPEFQACEPLSLLLLTSTSFYHATKSLALVGQTLDASCSANVTACQALMNSYADELIGTSCTQDYYNRNQNALEAYNGFLGYSALYYAGCLRGGETGTYCFASAVTNQSDPTASYVYYLPLGLALPSGTMPTCNGCLQNTFSVFANYAGNSSLPLYHTYPQATQQIDVTCGPNFVKPAVAAVAGNAATRGIPVPGYGVLSITILLALMSIG